MAASSVTFSVTLAVPKVTISAIIRLTGMNSSNFEPIVRLASTHASTSSGNKFMILPLKSFTSPIRRKFNSGFNACYEFNLFV